MTIMTNTSGSRIAKIIPQTDGRFLVYVGFKGCDTPGEETIPARFFRGTCSKAFATEATAKRKALAFLSE